MCNNEDIIIIIIIITNNISVNVLLMSFSHTTLHSHCNICDIVYSKVFRSKDLILLIHFGIIVKKGKRY